MAILLQADNLTQSIGERVLFEGLSFSINEGDRLGLIAPNGAGKTTLLRLMAGVAEQGADSGAIVARNDLRIGYLPQQPLYPPELTVLQACFRSDNPVVQTLARYEVASERGDGIEMQELIGAMDFHKAWDYERRVKQILTQLKVARFDQPMGQLSGGERRRVALASILIEEPDLLILDEPTNHLDLEMTEWLENYLNRSQVSLLMVTHDRYFLDRVCNTILEIDRRQLYTYKGNYSYYLVKREERIEAQAAELDRANNLYRKELEWMRRQPQARATKAKSRKDAFYDLEKKTKQGGASSSMQLGNSSAYLGGKIIEVRHLDKSFGTKKIVEDFSYTFARFEKIGIIGANGTGKSTFIKLIQQKLEPDGGEIEIGETIRFGYYNQDGLQFDETKRVIDTVMEIAESIEWAEGKRITASQLLQHFLFAPERQYDYVAKLSGGERQRLYLCTVLMQNPNFLILDEPTNDLDLMTINLLESYVVDFKGCVIVISHDRYFMDKIVDHTFIFHGDGQIYDFPGTYSDYRLYQTEKNKEQSAKAKTENQKNKSDTLSTTSAASSARRLTYKEKRELEELDRAIPQLEEQKNSIETQLCSGDLATDKLIELSTSVSQLIDQLDEKMVRWMELTEINEMK